MRRLMMALILGTVLAATALAGVAGAEYGPRDWGLASHQVMN